MICIPTEDLYFQVPNRFIRISPEGRISYSQRLTLKARCKMDLRKFPLDKQVCSLKIGSFGYSSEDIVYRYVYTYCIKHLYPKH